MVQLAWPNAAERVFRTVGQMPNRIPAYRMADVLALQEARRIRREQHRMGGLTQTYYELFETILNQSAFASSASEGSLISGNSQPSIPPFTFHAANRLGKSVVLIARGVFSNTSTPTIIFQWRLGTTQGASFLSGASVGVSATITTASGVTNQWWESRLDIIAQAPGSGSGNCTLQTNGYVTSPGGFASPFIYPLLPTTPPTGTWTATIDDSVLQWVNLSVTWGTSSSSNTITLKSLRGYCEN